MTEKEMAAREDRSRREWIGRCKAVDLSTQMWTDTHERQPKVLEEFYPALFKLYWWIALYRQDNA